MSSRLIFSMILFICLSGINGFAAPTDPRVSSGALPRQELPRTTQPYNQEMLATASAAANWAAWVAAAKQSVRTVLPQWVQLAGLTGGVVNGARVTEGALTGPNTLPMLTVYMKTAGAPDRIANGFMGPLSDAWLFWAASVRVPALPMYPTFEVVPAPMAPPTLSTAMPLVALQHVTAPLTPSMLAMTIRMRIGNDAAGPEAVAAINDFCNWFYSGFNMWLKTASIAEIIGTGGVPHFAPPAVNAGPVVGGTASGGRISPPPAWP